MTAIPAICLNTLAQLFAGMQAGQGVVTAAFELKVDTLMLLRLNVSSIDRLFASAPTVISAVVFRRASCPPAPVPRLHQPRACLHCRTCRRKIVELLRCTLLNPVLSRCRDCVHEGLCSLCVAKLEVSLWGTGAQGGVQVRGGVCQERGCLLVPRHRLRAEPRALRRLW